MAKILLKLHQPKKWDKSEYISDEEVAEYEKLIYNDLDVVKHIKKQSQEYDDSWIKDVLKEDETYIVLQHPLDNYALTSFGRIFNIKSMRQIKLNLTNNSFTITIKGKTINVKKLFVENGWIYSGSLLRQKHDQYKWGYCEVFPKYKK